jgi:putative heme-binding domain-containing protein
VGIDSRARAAAWLGALAVVAGGAARAQPQHAGQYEQADIEYGARLYAGRCTICHGERGDGMPGVNLRSGRFKNASTDRELTNVIRDGVAGTAMVPNAYTDSELTALVSYLRNFGSFDPGRGGKPGDAERGRQLFQGKGDCGSCHRVNGVGPRAAPDLSNVGAIRTASTLQRYLLDPTDAMLPINRPVRAVKRDGTVITGRRMNEDTHTVQIVDSHERLISLDKSQLREYTIGTAATMPSFATVFNDDERADLVEYLLSLKGMN